MKVTLNCRVAISKPNGTRFSFHCLNDCQIEKSNNKLGSTAKIKLPVTARLMKNGIYIGSEATAKKIERADRIDIYLGYDDQLNLEHSGYVTQVNFSNPMEIECQGFEFELRTDCPTMTWRKTTLKEVLRHVVKAGTEANANSIVIREKQEKEVKTATGHLIYSSSLPNISFSNLVIEAGKTRLQVLQKLKEDYRLSVTLRRNELWVGMNSVQGLQKVSYLLGHNTIREDELKFRSAEEVKLSVKAVWIKPDNSREEVEVGDKNGAVRTAFFYDISSKEHLMQMAQAELQKYKYSGYDGKITTFLLPFAEPGMVAIISDKHYAEREGNYYITSTKTSFGINGARRTVELGIKTEGNE